MLEFRVDLLQIARTHPACGLLNDIKVFTLCSGYDCKRARAIKPP